MDKALLRAEMSPEPLTGCTRSGQQKIAILGQTSVSMRQVHGTSRARTRAFVRVTRVTVFGRGLKLWWVSGEADHANRFRRGIQRTKTCGASPIANRNHDTVSLLCHLPRRACAVVRRPKLFKSGNRTAKLFLKPTLKFLCNSSGSLAILAAIRRARESPRMTLWTNSRRPCSAPKRMPN
jgi:hypothetical protein